MLVLKVQKLGKKAMEPQIKQAIGANTELIKTLESSLETYRTIGTILKNSSALTRKFIRIAKRSKSTC